MDNVVSFETLAAPLTVAIAECFGVDVELDAELAEAKRILAEAQAKVEEAEEKSANSWAKPAQVAFDMGITHAVRNLPKTHKIVFGEGMVTVSDFIKYLDIQIAQYKLSDEPVIAFGDEMLSEFDVSKPIMSQAKYKAIKELHPDVAENIEAVRNRAGEKFGQYRKRFWDNLAKIDPSYEEPQKEDKTEREKFESDFKRVLSKLLDVEKDLEMDDDYRREFGQNMIDIAGDLDIKLD